jgi:hypothetical protein
MAVQKAKIMNIQLGLETKIFRLLKHLKSVVNHNLSSYMLYAAYELLYL